MTGAACNLDHDNVWEPQLSAVMAAPRHLVTTRHPLVLGQVPGQQVVLPGGFACPTPRPGEVLTIPMDCGFLVHVESDGPAGARCALVSIELPPAAELPVDDDALAELAARARAHATDDEQKDRRSDPARTLRRAWTYRRACEGLAAAFPEDGGPILPVRWVTLSWEGRVFVDGIGMLDVTEDDMRADLPDGRWVEVRRIDEALAREGLGPLGAVEVVVGPAIPRAMPAPASASTTLDEKPSRRVRIRTSPRCVLLDG